MLCWREIAGNGDDVVLAAATSVAAATDECVRTTCVRNTAISSRTARPPRRGGGRRSADRRGAARLLLLFGLLLLNLFASLRLASFLRLARTPKIAQNNPGGQTRRKACGSCEVLQDAQGILTCSSVNCCKVWNVGILQQWLFRRRKFDCLSDVGIFLLCAVKARRTNRTACGLCDTCRARKRPQAKWAKQAKAI